MTPERSQSYGRLMKTLDEVGPAKLHEFEAKRLREAADTLLFAATHDPAAFDALAAAEHLTRHLAETGRWTAESACRLADDVAGCGPSLADMPEFDTPAQAA